MISIVIPCRNEAANLTFLIGEVSAALRDRDHEIIVIDDGSDDGTGSILAGLPQFSARTLRIIRHDSPAGQSAALRSGVFAARGEITVTMDGDGQNDPVYLPLLVDALLLGGDRIGIAAGRRLKRTDTRLKRLASRFANRIRGAILRDGTRDSGCGLKALPTDLFRQLPFFDGWHRYLPALVLREGRAVVQVDVVDRLRRHGKSNYGILDRGARGVLDLFGVWWLRRRRKTIPTVTEQVP